MIAGTTNSIGVRHKPSSTKQQRLEALLLAEKEERRLLASQYAQNLPKAHYKTPFPNRIIDNPYYKYFHSGDGDELTAQSLLPDVFVEQRKLLAKEHHDAQVKAEGVLKKEDSLLPSVSGTLLDKDYAIDDDLTYSPSRKKRDQGSKGVGKDGKPVAKKQHRPVKKEPPIDITALKPKSAELYVKYEKLYRLMLAEDREFVAFRKDYLARQREIEIENALRN